VLYQIPVITLLIRISCAIATNCKSTCGSTLIGKEGIQGTHITLFTATWLQNAITASAPGNNGQCAGTCTEICIHRVSVITLFTTIDNLVTTTRVCAVGATAVRYVTVLNSVITLFVRLFHGITATAASDRSGC
jgi:hypothetical protein